MGAAIHKSDDEWKAQLTPQQYQVLHEKGTEAPFSGAYSVPDSAGSYCCAGCGTMLFNTDRQYETTVPGLCGWPSFADVVDKDKIVLRPDDSHGMHRMEVVCATCNGHLGHVFDDSESNTGKHYCINSVALVFQSAEKESTV